ncbi:hypothetical protein DICPUDRAFT_148535 [Dictyostelium purpureum]|uniref:Purple acid phosphatase n=1 Tax=Dictyostelium purpureum TaxID=5786 RepID=F0ZBD4_DICPU|nr:uncharacterized protein DICPUDRAFT_148535 [Dictyostelium purpureum]EGC38727.1 hypothetical protein DICPUDRAFT_148535 [Dictyostelium purpureum]|eukprot:XP_003284718.1 hypothetical protein DICPUDRAFT_148535 [Dictyostelium purpureum]
MIKYILLFLTILNIGINGLEITPFSIKLAFTKERDSFRVTWWTKDKMKSPVALYSTEMFTPEKDSSFAVLGQVDNYDTIGYHGHPTTAVLNNLAESTTYFYCVGDKSEGVYSEVFNFTTGLITSPGFEPFTAVFYGDMGYGGTGLNSDNYTVANVLKRAEEFDFVVHVGDIAYADETAGSYINGNQTLYNLFLDSVNPLTSHLPYMVCPGNHDIFYDLSFYRRTWQMPTDKDSNSWYSFDYNGVHFVGFSSEHDWLKGSSQYKWIENDLKKYRASNPEGWLVLYSHRPFYCSTVWNWCENEKDLLKRAYVESLEELLYKYNVHVFLGGHAHEFELSLPVYNNQTMGTFEEPKATVHITVGTGGNVEGDQHNFQKQPIWSSGHRYSDQGFGMASFNETHFNWQFFSNKKSSVIFDFTLAKNKFN